MPVTSTFIAGVQTDFPQQPWVQFKNLLDGGDFTTNPFQRNISGLASSNLLAAPGNTNTSYFADRWFGVTTANAALQMGVIAANSITGFNNALTCGRNNTNANTATLYFGQVIETLDAIRVAGQPVTFSFWAALGANFTGANNTITVQIITGTGNNQNANTAVGNNWTNQANVFSGNQVLTSTMTRYAFSGIVPANSSELGVMLSYVPVGTAGANDNFQLMGCQLEAGGQATSFEHRDIQLETEICQRYAWVIAEPANNVVVGAGVANATNNETFYLATPVQMRAAPTVTVSAGNFKIRPGSSPAAATGLANGTTHTVNAVTLTATGTATAGQGCTLEGGGNNGYIVVSADL